MRQQNQCSRILEWWKTHKTITSKEAQDELGIARLASRITDLKQKYYIGTGRRTVTNRFGEKCSVTEYYLIGERIL